MSVTQRLTDLLFQKPNGFEKKSVECSKEQNILNEDLCILKRGRLNLFI